MLLFSLPFPPFLASGKSSRVCISFAFLFSSCCLCALVGLNVSIIFGHFFNLLFFLVLCVQNNLCVDSHADPSTSTLGEKRRAQEARHQNDAWEKICRLQLGKALRNSRGVVQGAEVGGFAEPASPKLFDISGSVLGVDYHRPPDNPDPPALKVCSSIRFVYLCLKFRVLSTGIYVLCVGGGRMNML